MVGLVCFRKGVISVVLVIIVVVMVVWVGL